MVIPRVAFIGLLDSLGVEQGLANESAISPGETMDSQYPGGVCLQLPLSSTFTISCLWAKYHLIINVM